VVGGIAAELGGGKFANGGMSNPLLKLPPDNRLRTPPVTPWAISLLKPAFIGCNTLALNPAVNAPNIPCFKSGRKILLGYESIGVDGTKKNHYLRIYGLFLYSIMFIISFLKLASKKYELT
jgi:hypothetical protein